MKISLALGQRKPLDRTTAWGCLTANLAVPGCGSLVAGRVSGYFQLLLAPVTVTGDYDFNSIPIAHAGDWDAWAGLLLIVLTVFLVATFGALGSAVTAVLLASDSTRDRVYFGTDTRAQALLELRADLAMAFPAALESLLLNLLQRLAQAVDEAGRRGVVVQTLRAPVRLDLQQVEVAGVGWLLASAHALLDVR